MLRLLNSHPRSIGQLLVTVNFDDIILQTLESFDVASTWELPVRKSHVSPRDVDINRV
jgi:hypothetical protein